MRIGTGWIGWTYDQTLDTPLEGILAAYEGRKEMLRAIFGGDEEPPAASAKRVQHGLVQQLAELAKREKGAIAK